MFSFKEHITTAIRTVFSDPLFLFLGASLGVNLLALFYFVFRQSTTFEVFFTSNNAFYNWTSIGLTLANAVLFGVALSMVAYILRKRMANAAAGTSNSLFAALFGVISSGCPVCGAWLLPTLGIAGSLAAFPLQGLEIKLLSILLLGFSINESSKSILGLCEVHSEKVLSWNGNHLSLNLSRKTWPQLRPLAIGLVALLLVYKLPDLPRQYKLSFANQSVGTSSSSVSSANGSVDSQSLFAQVNPPEGYTLGAKYGDLGPKILASGAIDLEKFKGIYERSGSPLTDEQLTILTKGSDKKITINQDNSYFLINFFWALGLANKNPLLEEGSIAQYGEGQIGSFASTGGWSVAEKDLFDFYSKSEIVSLTSEQQARVEEVASNTYRPCCGNSTAFPDCNHGMALLAVLELLGSNGATEGEMYEAGKYFNAFWFPQQTLDIATYFKVKEGLEFKDVDPKTVVSADFSSGQGWSKTKQWLASNNLVEKAPSGGGGCGV